MALAPGFAAVGQRRHVVQFYARERELAAGAGQYLAEGIADGSALVVVATLAHRLAFEHYLARVGAAVTAAQAEGRYQAVDAAALLRRFSSAGQVDAASFEAEVGHVIRAAGAAGRPVRVYGEMVALLWDAGQLNAALELEALWNDLAREIPFSLYCGYPELPATGEDHRAALAEVCRLHAAVVGVPPAMPRPARKVPAAARPGATRSFPLDRDAPRAARHFALDLLRGWRLGQRCGVTLASDVAIVVSELATNAVRHARSGFTVSLTLAGDVIRIRVEDARPLPGVHGDPPLPVSPDHGLGLVAAVSVRWGVQPADGGKTVWAELPLA